MVTLLFFGSTCTGESMLRPVTCTMLQKQPEWTWNLSRLGHGEKAGGPRTTSTKIPLAADETWHTLCDVVSGLRVTMRILSNTGDHTCSRSPASLFPESEFSEPTTNVVCCWAVTTIGMKGTTASNTRVGLTISRGRRCWTLRRTRGSFWFLSGGSDLTGSFIQVLLSYGGVILNAGLKITSLVNDLGKD